MPTIARVLLECAAGLIVLGGLVVLSGFVMLEAKARNPMMPLDVFRSRDFVGANLVTLLLYFGLGGALFFLPFTLIRAYGYSATEAGARPRPHSSSRSSWPPLTATPC